MSAIKRIGAVLLLVCLLCTCALAVEVPDLEAEGSISLTIRDPQTQQPISGGTFALYHVGDVQEDDGNYFFSLTNAFAPSGFLLEDMTSADLGDAALAADLWAHAQAFSAVQPVMTAAVASDGTLSFAPVGVGLYLVVQTEAADGYLPASPFLVSVPVRDGEGYDYSVDASPKITIETDPTPDTPDTPPSPPDDPDLPSTGQLRWPIPVLTIAGLLLFALGWSLYVKGKRNYAD